MSPAGAGGGRWTAADIPGQSGRTAVVTGASAGVGLETARMLARRGGTVVLACRDMAKAGLAADRIRAEAGRASVRVVRLDLASLASVREAASEIRSTCPRLDLLINNAGVMAPPYQRTEDGFELTFAGEASITVRRAGGEYTGSPARVESSSRSHDAAAQRQLWDVSEQLTGVSYRIPAASDERGTRELR